MVFSFGWSGVDVLSVVVSSPDEAVPGGDVLSDGICMPENWQDANADNVIPSKRIHANRCFFIAGRTPFEFLIILYHARRKM